MLEVVVEIPLNAGFLQQVTLAIGVDRGKLHGAVNTGIDQHLPWTHTGLFRSGAGS
jgi:hypothetical protein